MHDEDKLLSCCLIVISWLNNNFSCWIAEQGTALVLEDHLETWNTYFDAAPPTHGAGIPYSFNVILYSLVSRGSAGQSAV